MRWVSCETLKELGARKTCYFSIILVHCQRIEQNIRSQNTAQVVQHICKAKDRSAAVHSAIALGARYESLFKAGETLPQLQEKGMTLAALRAAGWDSPSHIFSELFPLSKMSLKRSEAELDCSIAKALFFSAGCSRSPIHSSITTTTTSGTKLIGPLPTPSD